MPPTLWQIIGLLMTVALAAEAPQPRSTPVEGERLEIEFCRPELTEPKKNANLTFSEIYSFTTDKTGSVNEVSREKGIVEGLHQEIVPCMLRWKVGKLCRSGERCLAVFSWKHGKGWTQLSIVGSGAVRIVLAGDNCPYSG